MSIAQKPISEVYINDVSNIPNTLSSGVVYYISGNINLGNGSINLPNDSYLIGIGNASIISTSPTPITGVDWQLRTMGITINGTPSDNGAVIKYPSILDVDIANLTTMVEGEVVWCSNQKRYVIYTQGEWRYLDDQTPLYIILFQEDFESGSFITNNWGVVNDTTNKWVVGTASKNTGIYSAYISNDNGISSAYTNNIANTSHIYIDVTIPANIIDAFIEFYWRGEGERGFDYGNVYKAPTTYTPIAGSFPSGVGVVLLNNRALNNNILWRNTKISLIPYIGQTIRLIFTARNDGSIGTNPLLEIDDIVIKYR